ncbi:MAG: 50S ribosomal protein L11 methyltransferase, partial [Desulfobulbaceae bacterium]|nr:50S ribosomal protein L11 methyltransferase [Desulfobulbaceae bacterium]
HCRSYAGGWLLTACGAPNADPDPLLRTVGALVDQFDSLAEVIDVRLGGNELPVSQDGYPISQRFRVGGTDCPIDANTIQLDAAHVFGTGAHASTRLAVLAMEEIADWEGGLPGSVLDVGTGSGVLAMIAARLGGASVQGIDICEEALAIARRNVAANGLHDLVSFSSTPLAELPGSYAMIVANVTASVLLRLADGIDERLQSGGWLVVSGMQGRQGEEIEKALSGRYGFEAVACSSEGKWHCLTLRKSSST